MEAELIAHLRKMLPAHPLLKLGPGDDAAVLRVANLEECVVTVDLLSDHVDFELSEVDARRVGRKLLAVNLSDLAAMASRPLAAVIALVLPRAGGMRLAVELYEGLLPLAEQYGLIIAGGLPHAIITIVTSAFLHGSLPHVGINMLFLWVFGDNVEDRMGHGRYLLFYVTCAVAGSLAHALLTGFADTPLMGASGAIAGVMGAYFVLFRLAQIRTLVIIIFFPIVFDLPAPIFLVYWFFLQLFAGVGSIGIAHGTAFWAHVGGFAAGYFLVKRFAQPLRPPPTRLIRPHVVDMRIE